MKVTWDEKACCHSGNCVGSLPEVFTVENDRLVIRPGNSNAEKVSEIVAACPGKALKIETD